MAEAYRFKREVSKDQLWAVYLAWPAISLLEEDGKYYVIPSRLEKALGIVDLVTGEVENG